MSTWINFREIRKSLSFEAVLKHYGVTIKKKQGNRHVGFCPLPTHKGKRNSPSFSAKLDVGVFQCFGCKAQGTVLHFATAMEGLDPKIPHDLRTVALKLRDAGLASGGTGKHASPPKATKPSLPVVVNPPLDFELKDLDCEHQYLRGRGFHQETIRHFGLGFCNRGLMKGRVVIPLHDPDGRLVGYAGRVIDDAAISEDNPRYRLPGRRERKDKIIEFKKSLLLYNLHRIKRPISDIIVVEGFASVWWLHQWGYPSAVALIGSDCSDAQSRLIVEATASDGRVWIFTDADDAGEKCAAAVLTRVAPHRWTRWVKPEKGQPTDCTPADLEGILPDICVGKEWGHAGGIL